MKSAYPAHWCPERYHAFSITRLQHDIYTTYHDISAHLDNAHKVS